MSPGRLACGVVAVHNAGMEIVLVQPPIGGAKEDVTPPLGLLQLAAVAEADGHRVRIADLNLLVKRGRVDPARPALPQLLAAIPSDRIDFLGLTTWSYNFGITMELAVALKEARPEVTLGLGGPHATFVSEEALSVFPQVDLILRDEGDRTFPQLLRALQYERPPEKLALVPGLTWRRGDAVQKNPGGGVVEDLDALPYPAFHLVDVREYLACQPTLIVEAGRGCPFNCNFCSTTNMFQRQYRVKSPKRLIDEVEWLMKHSGGRRFELLHDNLVASKKHVLALCEEIRARNLDFDWSCTSRTDTLTEEVAEAMFLAGCVSIFFGVESLSAERQRWTGKKLKPALIEAAVAMTRRQHITPSVGIIVGFPEESDQELNATLEAAVRWTSEPAIQAEVSTAALRYYPGADLFVHNDQLRYDDLASVDVNPVKGYRLRESWRPHVSTLFPLDAIHTPPEETRRNLLRRNFVRTLLKACPHTLRACLTRLQIPPKELLERMDGGRRFRSLEQPDRLTLWNETLKALGEVIAASGSAEVQELFTCEVPFWRSQPVAPPLKRLERVKQPKLFEQQSLLEWSRGAREAPPERVEGQWLLSIRCGFENVVWFTPDPDKVWQVFQDGFARDPQGTIEFVNSLKRGL